MVSTTASVATAAMIVCGGAAVAAAAAASSSSSSSNVDLMSDPLMLMRASALALRTASAAAVASSSSSFAASSSYYFQGGEIAEVARVVVSGRLVGGKQRTKKLTIECLERRPEGKQRRTRFFFLPPPSLKLTLDFQKNPLSPSLFFSSHSRRRRRPGRLGLRPRPGLRPSAGLPAEGGKREPQGGRGEVRHRRRRERWPRELVDGRVLGPKKTLSFPRISLCFFIKPSLSLYLALCFVTLHCTKKKE